MKTNLAVFLVALLLVTPTTGCSSSLIDTILTDLPVATDIAISIVNIVSPGDASYVAEVTEYSAKAGADLKLLESLIRQYQGNLAGAPAGAIAQMNAALNDCQANLTSILNAVGVSDPKVTAAVAAAVASVKIILGDAAQLVKNSAPASTTAMLFAGVGMPGVDFLAAVPVSGAAPGKATSGKSARQLAKEYNQKISKDFPKAKVNVPRIHVFGKWIQAQGQTGNTTGVPNFADAEVPAGVINGVNPQFTLANVPNPVSSLQLFKNGQKLTSGIGFTLNGTTITYAAGYIPHPGDTHEAFYRH